MSDVLMLVIPWFFSMGACSALVLWDRRRLWNRVRHHGHRDLPSGMGSDQRRLALNHLQRGWNCASFGTAIFAFAPFCVVPYFWVTRRSFLGVLWGLLGLLALLVAQSAFSLVLGWMVGSGP